jgi:hypothetical protein
MEIVKRILIRVKIKVVPGILKGWTAGFRFLVVARNLYIFHSVKTSSDAYPSSSKMGSGSSFPGDKEVVS